MSNTERNNAARMGLQCTTEDSREIMIRTVYAEAFGEGPIGMEAVAWVIRNRAESGQFGGRTPGSVCLSSHQFEPWRSSAGVRRIENLEHGSDRYRQVAAIVDRVMAAPESADITGGSTHFANAEVVRGRRGGGITDWMARFMREGRSFDLGNHTFYGGDPEQARTALSRRGRDEGFTLSNNPADRDAPRTEGENPMVIFFASIFEMLAQLVSSITGGLGGQPADAGDNKLPTSGTPLASPQPAARTTA